MYTVVETESFKAEIAQLLDLDDRLAFFTYLSQNPLKGDVWIATKILDTHNRLMMVFLIL